jgi:hypothetical protein
MAEPLNQVLKDEFQVSFFIKLSKVEGYHGEYYKLQTEIRTEEDTINYEHNNPEQYPVDEILENIKKLYGIYIYGKNEKLIEGAREEILKLIALLIWNIFY